MKETRWIGKSGGKVSDPNNWDNGLPDYRTKAIFDVSERTEITWDLKSLGIPVEILSDPEDVIIYISGDCMVGGSYFVPDAIQDHFEAFKDDSLNPDVLDRPPPGYGMFNTQTEYIWTNGNDNGNWEEHGNWSRAQWPGKTKTDDKALFDGNVDDNCDVFRALTIGDLEMLSGYTGTLKLGLGKLTIDDSGDGSGNVTVDGGTFDAYSQDVDIDGDIAFTANVRGRSGTFTVRGNWVNTGSGSFTAETSTILISGSAAQSIESNGDYFYNIGIGNSGNVDITIVDDLDVNGYFNCSSPSPTLRLDTNDPNINTAGNVSFNIGFSVTPGGGTWTFDGSTNYSDDNAPANTIDIGNISVNDSGVGTLSLGSDIKVDDCSIFDTLSASSYKISVQGDWTIDTGSFDRGTSTVEFNGTATQVILTQGEIFHNLTISNSSNNHIDSGGGLFIYGTFDCYTSDCCLDLSNGNPVYVRGDVTFGQDFTVLNASPNPWTFEGTLSYEDNNSTAQDLGMVVLDWPDFGSMTVTLDTHIRFISITIGRSTILSGNQDIYCGGDWTRSGSGAFTYGTSHVHFEGNATIRGMSGPTDRFANLTIDFGYDVNTPTMVELIPPDGELYGLSCLTRDYGSSTNVLQIVKILTVDGTFHVSNRQILYRKC